MMKDQDGKTFIGSDKKRYPYDITELFEKLPVELKTKYNSMSKSEIDLEFFEYLYENDRFTKENLQLFNQLKKILCEQIGLK